MIIVRLILHYTVLSDWSEGVDSFSITVVPAIIPIIVTLQYIASNSQRLHNNLQRFWTVIEQR